MLLLWYLERHPVFYHGNFLVLFSKYYLHAERLQSLYMSEVNTACSIHSLDDFVL